MEKSILLKTEEMPPEVNYSNEELEVIGRLLSRILTAQIARDSVKLEFNNMTYLQWFKNNEAIANTTIIRTDENKDLAVYSGTVEQKLLSVLSEVNILNLTGELRVFDKESNELQEFSTGLTEIVHKTEEIEDSVSEGSQEGKLLRQLELLKQGTVFVQDNWVKKWGTSKKLNKKFDGKIKGVDWTSKLEKVFDGPIREVLYGPGVYLGNIREFEIKKQPFIFSMKLNSYQDVKTRFGMQKDGEDVWERWKNVPKQRVSMVNIDTLTNMPLGAGWSITDLDQDMVEEIHYQDQINNEYQIFLNGIAMLPVGFPLSAITPGGVFNIEKQVLQVINPFFAYGRSFIAKTEQLSRLLDEMIRLLIIKTRKSIHPPYANISGKVISEKSLMPGAISMGLDPGALVPIGTEGQGATASEYQMLKELREDIDRVTVSPQFQGQSANKSGTTAFEVQTLQAQAQKSLTLIIFAMGLLEKKLTWLRGLYVLANYFEPIGTKVDETRNQLVNIYRTISVNTQIPDRGPGIRKIIPVDSTNKMTPDDVYNQEEYDGTPVPTVGRRRTREELGMEPLQHLYLDVDIIKNCKYILFAEVEAKPRDTSVNAKLMFREELRDLQAMQQMGSNVSMEEIQNDYALVWNKKKEKRFGKARDMAQEEMKPQGGGNVLNDNGPALQPEVSGVS